MHDILIKLGKMQRVRRRATRISSITAGRENLDSHAENNWQHIKGERTWDFLPREVLHMYRWMDTRMNTRFNVSLLIEVKYCEQLKWSPITHCYLPTLGYNVMNTAASISTWMDFKYIILN